MHLPRRGSTSRRPAKGTGPTNGRACCRGGFAHPNPTTPRPGRQSWNPSASISSAGSAGGDLLAGSVDGHPKMAKRLRRLTCCRVHQDADDGLTVLFHVDDFDRVARIMRPRLRRQPSEAELQRLRAMGYKKGHQTPP